MMLLNQSKPAPIKNVRTNKTFLARFGSNNGNSSFENLNKNNSNVNNIESPIVMKCLNELPKTKVINNKKSKNIEISPPLISKNKQNDFNNDDSTQNDDLSIISHHSSTNSKDDEFIKLKINKNINVEVKSNNILTDEESNLDNNEQSQVDILTIYGKEDDHNPNHTAKNVTSYYHETQQMNEEETLLPQGNDDNNIENETQNDENQIQNNDIRISRYVQDKSKIRSQFMQRFAVAPKRQIIPQVIINIDKDSSFNEKNLNNSNSDLNLINNNENKSPLLNNTDSLTASLAASLAVTVTQPFLKIQNDLENKMNNLLKQFETNKKDDNYEIAKQKIEDDIKNLTEMKLGYIEKLQENQFQLMTQLIGVMGKENMTQNTDQAQDRLNYLLNDYKNELINFKLKMNNLEPVHDDNRFKTQTLSTINSDSKNYVNKNSRGKNKASKSPNKKATTSKKPDKRAESRSTSPIKTFEPEYSCLQCSINNCVKHGRKANDFLEELLDNSSPDRKYNDMSLSPNKNFNQDNDNSFKQIKNEPILPIKKATIDFKDDELLFDKYLNHGRALDQMMQTNLKNTQSEDYKQQLAQAHRHQAPKKSTITDLEEQLKEIEKSRDSFEENMKALLRNRDSNYFHSISSTSLIDKEEAEKIRVQKLVDGYLNVISKEIEKEVLQELIDKSNHVKLEAEKDIDPRSRTRARIAAKNAAAAAAAVNNKPQPLKKQNKMTCEKYLKSVYGNDLYEKIKKTDIKNFEWSKETDPNKISIGGSNRLDDDIFDRIVSKPINVTSKQFPRHVEPKKNVVTVTKPKENPIKVEKLKKPSPNVVIHTVPFIDDKKTQPLKKQTLPPVNISPEPDVKPIEENNTPRKITYEDDFENENEKSEVDDKINENGTGITYPGYFKKPIEIDEEFKYPKPSPRKDKDKELHIIQPSSDEIAERLKSRDLLENKALDWIEQELMARFVNTLVANEPKEIKDPVFNLNFHSDDDNDDDEASSELSINENVILNAIGEQGFQLFVDSGQALDPDLIQALVREVLEEKIVTMIGNDKLFDDSIDDMKEQVKPPQPTPRNTERFSNGHLTLNLNQVETPKPTPVHSPVTSPRIAMRKIVTPETTPRNSIVEEPKLPEPHIKPIVIPQVVEIDEETETLIETASDEENEEVELIFDQKLIIIPKTPEETPRNSPSPPSTPSITQPIQQKQQSPPPPPLPLEQPKKLVSSSVQCDPEPKPKITPTIPVIAPKRTVSPIKSSSSSSSTSVSLTSSTSGLSKEGLSTTSDEQSYLSEGCWLISRSEGQVVPNDKIKKVPTTEKNLMSMVQIETTDSEGEIKYDKMPNVNIKQKKQIKSNLMRMDSDGEVQLKSSLNGPEKSEGEIMNNDKINNQNLNKFFTTENDNFIPNGINKEKTIVNLRLNKKGPTKNNIQIEPLPNDLKDSKEFDRKIFSSTPDSSAAFTSSLKRIDLPNDIVDYRIPNESEDFSNRQSPTKKKHIINLNKLRGDEEDENTLSNFSDDDDY